MYLGYRWLGMGSGWMMFEGMDVEDRGRKIGFYTRLKGRISGRRRGPRNGTGVSLILRVVILEGRVRVEIIH